MMSEKFFELGLEAQEWWGRYVALRDTPCSPMGITEEGAPIYRPETQAVIDEFRAFPGKAAEHFLPKLAGLIAEREAASHLHFRRELVLHLLHGFEGEGHGLGNDEFAKMVVSRAVAIERALEARAK